MIEIYTQPGCKWCEKAKELVKTYNKEYKEYVLIKDINPIDFRSKFPKAIMVPQIVVDGTHIGGYNDLVKYIEDTANGFGEQQL